jgi:hypothetical protein
MFSFIVILLQAFFSMLFTKRKDIIFSMLLLKKENEILKRLLNLQNKKLMFTRKERFTLACIRSLSDRATKHWMGYWMGYTILDKKDKDMLIS